MSSSFYNNGVRCTAMNWWIITHVFGSIIYICGMSHYCQADTYWRAKENGPKNGSLSQPCHPKNWGRKVAATRGIWMARTHNDFPAIRQESAISYRSWRAKTFEEVFVRLGCVKRGVPEVGNALYLASWLLVSMISWDLSIYIYYLIISVLQLWTGSKFNDHSRLDCLRRLRFFTSLCLGPFSELRIYPRNRQARQQQYIAKKKADKEEAVRRTLCWPGIRQVSESSALSGLKIWS